MSNMILIITAWCNNLQHLYHGLFGSNKLLYKRCAKSMGRPEFRPPLFPHFSTDFNETQNQERYPGHDPTCKIWLMWDNGKGVCVGRAFSVRWIYNAHVRCGDAVAFVVRSDDAGDLGPDDVEEVSHVSSQWSGTSAADGLRLVGCSVTADQRQRPVDLALRHYLTYAQAASIYIVVVCSVLSDAC